MLKQGASLETQVASGACQTILVASYAAAEDGTRCLLNVAALVAGAGYRVVCTSLAANAYGFDRVACEGDDAAVATLRGKPGLYDLLGEYRKTLLRAPFEAEDEGAPGPAAADSMRVGALTFRRPSSCLINPVIATSRRLPIRILRGGPSANDWLGGSGDRSAFPDDEGTELYFELLKRDLPADVLLVDCPDARVLEQTIERLARSAVDTLLVLTRYTDEDMAPAFHSLARIAGTDGQPPQPHVPALLVVASGVEQGEASLQQEARDFFVSRFSKFLASEAPSDFLLRTEIPRVPYAERIRTLTVGMEEFDRLLKVPYETIAGTIGRLASRARSPLTAGEMERRLAQLPFLARWDVFLSHSSRQDGAARQLRQELVDVHGLHTFVAEVDLASRIGSDLWRKAIDTALAASETLVVLVTADAMLSTEVAYEIQTFEALMKSRGRGLIIPVYVESPTAEDGKSGLLSKYQAVFCSDGAVGSEEREKINVLVRGAARR